MTYFDPRFFASWMRDFNGPWYYGPSSSGKITLPPPQPFSLYETCPQDPGYLPTRPLMSNDVLSVNAYPYQDVNLDQAGWYGLVYQQDSSTGERLYREF